ncbi:amino acid adenylation domain-containing protein, partial [Pedobacter cryoconitis]|nr:amino acid adenylation domain-containing protein [Pedobacter cryoconitis]
MDNTDRILQFSTISFDASVEQIWLALLSGAGLVLVKKEVITDQALLNSYLHNHQVTHLHATPSFLESISLSEPNNLRRIIAAGEVCRAELANRYLDKYDFYNKYGPTECTISCLIYRATQTISSGSGVPVGRPVTGTSVYILDQYQGLSPEGVAGELYVSGLGLASGYVNNIALTAEKFVENPFEPGSLMYRTGDLVRWTEDGNINYLGRIDDQVKIRGYRIEPGEIEVVISGLEEINQALVLVKEQGDDKYLVAYYTAAEAVADLKQRLQDLLPDYMLPSHYVHLSAFPLTVNGKIDRRALPEIVLNTEDSYQGPSNLIETKLLSIWSEILKIDEDKISVNRSFFDLGGHSLKAMSLVNRIRKELGTEVSLKVVFSHQDIRSLSAYILEMAFGSDYNVIPLAAEKTHYVLSSAQKRLYFLYEFDRDSLAYNMPQAAWLSGELDRKRLADAFQALIRRHEVFRTTIVMIEDEPFQVVGDGEGFSITDYQAQREEVAGVMESFIRPFDLGQGPLLRVGLVHVPGGESLLMVDMHHIITDGVSHGILIRDFMALYAGEDLPAPGLQYKDYAEWQQSAIEQDRMAKQRSFWLSEYQDLPEALDLPLDYARPKQAEHQSGSYSFELDEQTTRSISRLGEEQGATLFMVLLSVYTILLSRLGNREDVVVGIPTAGRRHADLEGVIGVFINMLALRNYPVGDLSFKDFLAEVSSRTLSCFDHQDFQYEDLVDELKLPRNTGRNPLFEATFSYQNYESESLSIPGLALSPYEQEAGGISKFDLSLFASEHSGCLYLSLVYSTALFSESSISRFGDYFQQMIKAVVADPGIQLRKLDLLSSAERSRLLELGKGASASYTTERTVVDLFCEQALNYPDATAIVFEDHVLTYRELDQLSNQLASRLQSSHQIAAGDTVGICLGRSGLMLVGILGILKAGGVYVPFDIDYPQERKSYICADAGIRLLLTVTDHVFDVVDYYSGSILALDVELDLTADRDSYSRPVVAIHGESLAYISYTSGSTGNPKGVMVPHQAILRLLSLSDIVLDKNTVTLQLSSISFDAATFEIWASLLSGGKVVIGGDGAIDIGRLNSLIEKEGVNTLWLTSGLLDQWAESDLSGLPLRYLLSGGDVVRASSVVKVYRQLAAVRIYNGYGPTENTTFTCCYPIPRDIQEDEHIPIGRPITGTNVYVLNSSGSLSPAGVAGELCTSGLGLAHGYVNNAVLTDEKFVKNPFEPDSLMYRTGDLVRWSADGNLLFLGRIDNQVKIRGYRIEPGEIEVVISGLEEINQALVLVKEQGGDKYLVAYYTAAEAIADLRQRLQGLLPDYMLPSYYVHLPAFPLTANGKVDRRALPDAILDIEDNYEAPSSKMEHTLVEIWSEILKIDQDKISVNRSFFDLGGHSLRAMSLANRIWKELGAEVSLKAIFSHQDIRSLSVYIGELVPGSVYTGILLAADKPYYVLSSAQKRMYFLYEFDRNSLAYNMPRAAWLSGELDQERLAGAFRALIRRHEVLRTTIVMIGDEPFQVIGDGSNFSITNYQAQREEVAGVMESFIRPFDLGQGPLLRVGLVHVPGGDSLLIVDMHHIITDGVSHGILIRDFMALYAGEDLPAPALQYKDYAEWQQSTAEQDRMEKQRSFWLSEYQDLPDVLDLPCDYLRPDHRNHRGDSYSFELDEQTTTSLRYLGEQHGATLYTVLLSVYTILLGRLSRSEDVVVGTPIAGRRHADLDGMIGMFVNTLALRNYPLGELSFEDFLAGVSSRTLSCFDHQDFQYEDLVDELNLPRNLGRSPLIEVMFSYENFEREELVIPGLTLNSYQQEGEMSSKFDLSLAAGEDSGKLYLSFAYSAELFKETTISRFATYFKHIVGQVLAAPDIRLSEIGLLVPAEHSRLLELGTGAIPAYSANQTIVQLFEAQVLQSPDAVALVFEDQVLSYQELDKRSDQLSLFLAGRGVARGTVIGLLFERSPDMIIGILGILKAGGTYVPIDSVLPQERILYMLMDSGSGFLLTSSAYAELYQDHIPVLDIAEAKTEDSLKGTLVSEPEDLLYIIYTSGSSGKPKGVMVNNVSLVNYIQSQLNLFKIDNTDRILQFSTISFDASVEQIWLALLSGAGLVLIGKDMLTDQALFNSYLQDHQVTHLHATPSFLESISLSEPNNLRRIIAGGEVCRAELANRYLEKYDFYNEYGPTECTISCLVYQAVQTISSGSGVPVGRPVTGTSVYILDQYQGLSPEGVAGELYVSGLGLASGYVNNIALTAEKFVENPFEPGSLMYRTGDLVRWTEDGNIDYLGRIDDQVKLRGYRIEPGEIEVVISGLEEINQALVLVKEQGDDKYLVAYYTAAEAVADLKQRLQDILPDYMLPSYYVHLPAFPLTVNGKIDRRALPEIVLNTEDSYQGPSNLIETKLLSIWSEILKIDEDKISVNRSFFDLGGHSLKAMSLVNRIRKELGTEVSLKAVFSHQDIRSLSVYIGELVPGSVYSAIPLTVKKTHYVLSSAQKRMYFLYEFDRDSLAYNMPQAAWLSGELDQERLAGAFQALIRRHEVLRTTIVMIEDEPFQVIGDGEGFSITNYLAQREEVAGVMESFIRPFDLGQGPLLRVGLVHVPGGDSLLMVDMHHIITDGVSHGILIRDFMALYTGEDLPAPALQYKDYAEWQQSTAEQDLIAEQRSFWLSEYQDLPEVLDLPLDYARPDHRNHRGDSYSFELDEQATTSLRYLGEQHGATLYTILLSVYTILLGRLSRSEDVVVGTPIAGRRHADLDGMIGMFVNTLALRNYPLGELSFEGFLAGVSSRTLSCFDYQDFQYEDLVDELKLTRDLGRSPLIEVMFSYANFEREELIIPGLTLNPYQQEGEMSSKFDLSLAAIEDSGKLYLSFGYSAELFKETTISRFATYFKHIVGQVLAAPDIRLSEIGLLVPAERSRLLELGT